MFDSIQLAPPDPILGLTEAYLADPNPAKINLSVGVYKDASGKTPVLHCVKAAEREILEDEATKGYLGIDGHPQYGARVRELLCGHERAEQLGGRARTLQTPGGTGALRVAGELIAGQFPGAAIYLSKPTWANHGNIFRAAGVEVKEYAYINETKTDLNFDGMMSDLNSIPEGQVVLLHGCCHNPTGIDPTSEQWRQIAQTLRERNVLPLLDFAYQGFAEGVHEDRTGLAAFAETESDLLVCSSFSKNFGLYGERVGALSIFAGSDEAGAAALSQAKACVRANYSNPPKHGALIVATVLANDALRVQWEGELGEMRSRIHQMRELFVSTMKEKAPDHDFSFIVQQRGMFSFSGLTPVQVDELRAKHSIYIVGSGRINVAGMTNDNMNTLCDAIASVL